MNATAARQAIDLGHEWAETNRWTGITRDYAAEDVIRLRGSVQVEQTLARHGAEKLWRLLHEEDYVAALGALTGGQAVQMVKAGLKAIYLSGWQVAADGNLATQVYPDQSLYPANSVPAMVRRLNNALLRADQIDWAEGNDRHGLARPDRRRRGGRLRRPAQRVRADEGDDRGGRGGRALRGSARGREEVRPPRRQGARADGPVHPHAARGAARGRRPRRARPSSSPAPTPTRRTLLTSDVDERDAEFLTGERTPEGFFSVRAGVEAAIARGLAYAPYADIVWMETSTPDLGEAREFAEAIHAEFPGKLLAYNCSPSFNWKRHLDDETIATFQQELGELGYRFQFITLAGFHALNESMFELARGYAAEGMSAYVRLQEREFALEENGYTATRHQREVGAGYFDEVARAVSGGLSSTLALTGSTEEAQFARNGAAH